MASIKIFKDRADAGRQLAKILQRYHGQKAVILALPRGGVITGKEIAQSLNLPLGLVIVRKIGHPDDPEYAIAAISENNQIVTNDAEVKNIDSLWFEAESRRQLDEAKRRRAKYWGDRRSLELKGKIAVIVDDGLATGLTMLAAIKEVKSQKPDKIIVAVPIAPFEIAQKIELLVDDFIAVSLPDLFLGSVGYYYENFPQISDQEVIQALKNNYSGKII